MDHRFICQDCGTKWFIQEHRVSELDLLTDCGRCGGRLVRFVNGSGDDGYGSGPGEGEGELGEDR